MGLPKKRKEVGEVEVLPKKVGRKPQHDYWITPEGLQLVEDWSRTGLFNMQIARNMGINQSTLYDWFGKFPELGEAIKAGRAVVDKEVENAMFKRAMGYQYEEEVAELNEDGELIVVKRTTKTEAPNTAAQIFWLKNRMPDQWRDKVEVDNQHSGTIKVELGSMEKWSE